MKLRNKKTGEIRKAEAREDGIYLWDELTEHWWKYGLELLASGWEYYVEPAEPLIKDEKIRKAVRAWWKTIPDAITDKRVLYKKNQDLAVGVYTIYCGASYPETLEVGKMYTIDELCGEDEE